MTIPKTLCSAALATATGLAMAQTAPTSSVTLSGIVDLSVGRYGAPAAGVNAANVKDSKVDGAGGMSLSRVNLSGSEVLGEGLTANFELSTFLRPNTGNSGRSEALGAPVNVAADPFWSRAAWVGLTSTRFGRVRVGNISTLMFINSITSNAFGDSTVFSPLNLVMFIGGPLTGGTGWTDHIIIDSPAIAGFTASAAVAATGNDGGRNYAARAVYANGPLATSFAWQSVKKNPVTFADGTSPNNTKTWQLALSYDLKVVKLFGHIGRIQNDGTEAAPTDVAYKLWELSAAVPLGSGKVLLGYAARKTDDTVAPVPATVAGGNVDRKVLTLGYDHVLSPRTDLYAMVLNDKTVTRTLPAPPRLVSASGSNVAVGMRHRF